MIDSLSSLLIPGISASSLVEIHLEMAKQFENLGKTDSALTHYQLAVDYSDDNDDNNHKGLAQFYIGDILFDLYNYEPALFHGKQAQAFAEIKGDSVLLIDIHNLIGKSYWAMGDIGLAFENYRIALLIAEAKQLIRQQGVMHNGLGTLFWRLGEYDMALTQYQESLGLRIEAGDQRGQVLVLNNIGMVLNEWGEHEAALKHFNDARDIASTLDYPAGQAYTFYNIGNYLQLRGHYDSAVFYYNLGIETYQAANQGGGVRLCQSELAPTYLAQGRVDQAEAIYADLLKTASNVKNKNQQAIGLNGLARVQFERKSYNNALSFIQRSLDIDQFDNAVIINNRELLSQVHGKMGNHKLALEEYKIARVLSDSIFSDKKRRQFALMQAEIEMQKKDRDNELLKNDLRLKEQLLKSNQIIMLFSLGGAFLAVLLLIVLYRANQNKSQLNLALSKKNEEIQDKTILIEEQNSILTSHNQAKDQLIATMGHDIKSPLVSIKGLIGLVNSGKLPEEENRNLFTTLEGQVDQVNEMLDNLLAWSVTQLGGLKTNAVEVDVSKMVKAQHRLFATKIEEKKILVVEAFDSSLMALVDEQHLNMVIRNLISNAIKFTKSGGNVKLTTLSSEGRIGFSIKDDGVGLSAEEISNLMNKAGVAESKLGTNNEKGTGLGLMLTQELIDKNNGKLEIHSLTNKGSEFIVWFPSAITNHV